MSSSASVLILVELVRQTWRVSGGAYQMDEQGRTWMPIAIASERVR